MSLKSKSQNSTQFKVGVLGQNEQSPTRFESVVGVTNPFVPTGFRDISSGVARDLNWMSSGPPMLIMPSKPFLVQNGESSLICDQFQPSSSVERSKETPKPKLNPLHWDKVGGS
uniref:Uncharacterized protein n=1 Tax=Rhizophora mucronata TaxID=61149 RepID=A0A2P2NR69_RHIMU